MAFDYRKAFETGSDGFLIEDGVLIISGAIDPVTISMNVPAIYFRTNGEIYKHTGTGTWALATSSEVFNEDKILVDNEFSILTDNEYNVLRES